jgi:hypothetical protein
LILYAVSIFWAGATLGGGIRASYFSSDYYGIRPGPGIALRGTSVGNASEETSSIMDLGKAYFLQNCAICHQPNGIGVPGVYPPLAGSPYINGDARRLAMIVLKGIQGTITVDGRKFNGTMPILGCSNPKHGQPVTRIRYRQQILNRVILKSRAISTGC